MKNFTRTKEIDTLRWDRIKETMKRNLADLTAGRYSREETEKLAAELVRQARPFKKFNKEKQSFEKDERQSYWGFVNPYSCPTDTRRFYYYEPTFIAVTQLMTIKINDPAISDHIENFDRTLCKGMYASTTSHFIVEEWNNYPMTAMEIFLTGKTAAFIKQYPDFCPEFTNLFNQTVEETANRINSGNTGDGCGSDISESFENIYLAAMGHHCRKDE